VKTDLLITFEKCTVAAEAGHDEALKWASQ